MTDLQADLILRGERPRLADFRLAVFDMDSTLIAIECIDEIAALAGQGEAVAAITEAAMRGEIPDFRESLRRRLALLEGQPETLLQRVLTERLRFTPGARELCAALKAAGLQLALVSGGFTFFTRFVAAELGMNAVRANALEIADCTSSAAASMLRPRSNSSVIWLLPSTLVDVIEERPAIVENWRSSGAATETAIV